MLILFAKSTLSSSVSVLAKKQMANIFKCHTNFPKCNKCKIRLTTHKYCPSLSFHCLPSLSLSAPLTHSLSNRACCAKCFGDT